MKSIHVRFEDEVYEKIKQEADENGQSLQAFLYQKVTEIETKSQPKVNKIQKENQQILNQIHQDLCLILHGINDIKSHLEDDKIDYSYLNFSISELKDDIIKSLKKTQSDLRKVK